MSELSKANSKTRGDPEGAVPVDEDELQLVNTIHDGLGWTYAFLWL